MTAIRLAMVVSASSAGRYGFLFDDDEVTEDQNPSVLASFHYLSGFLKIKDKLKITEWVMDSGAFSAHNSGAAIDIGQLIETAQELKRTDTRLTEVFALDVIGDWRAGLKNCETMWKHGIEAIPCFHVGDPDDVLIALARDYPKIALGGAVGFKGKSEWARRVFARVWPCRMHGFGFGGQRDILTLPFHTVDATNWEVGPSKFGAWRSFGGASLPIRGSHHPLKAEVEHYLRLEQRAKKQWQREMELLSTLPTTRRG